MHNNLCSLNETMVLFITSIDFLFIQPFIWPLFSGQQELSNLDYYFQDGWKTGAQTNQSFWKLKNIFWWSKVPHIIIKGWNFMIKSFSGQIVFCFAVIRAIFAYVGENWLSQYSGLFPRQLSQLLSIKRPQTLKCYSVLSLFPYFCFSFAHRFVQITAFLTS